MRERQDTARARYLARVIGCLARYLLDNDPNAIAVFRQALADAREQR